MYFSIKIIMNILKGKSISAFVLHCVEHYRRVFPFEPSVSTNTKEFSFQSCLFIPT